VGKSFSALVELTLLTIWKNRRSWCLDQTKQNGTTPKNLIAPALANSGQFSID